MKERKSRYAVREHRNFLLALWGVGVSKLAHYLFSFAMGLYVLRQTGSAQSFALTVCISLLPSALLSPIVGTLADRVSKKVLIVGADLLNALVMFSVFLYSLTAPLSVEVVYLATFLLSVLGPFVGITFSSATPRLVGDGTVPKLISMKSAVESFIQIAAPVIGGLVYAVVDIELFVLGAGVAFLLSGISELWIDYNFNPLLTEAGAAAAPRESMLASLGAGARFLCSKDYLMVAAIASLAINFMFSGFDALFPYSLLQLLHLSESSYGVVMGAIPAGMLLGAVFLSRRSVTLTRPLLVRAVLGFSVFCFLMILPFVLGLGGELAVSAYYVVTTFVLGLIIAIINISASVFLQTVVPGELLGRVSGLFAMASMLVTPVGVMLFGTLADYVHPGYLFAASGAGLCITALLFNRTRVLDRKIAQMEQSDTSSEAAA